METRYCIEYINPQYPLRDDGSLNVRYDRVLTLEQAEHDLTLILSFGCKILDLYMGNVVDGETGEWSPKPMIIDDDDWFTTKWLNTIEVRGVDFGKEIDLVEDKYHGFESLSRADIIEIIKHFFELGMQVSNKAKNIWHDANEKLPTGVIVVNNGGNLHIGWSTDEGDGIEDEHGRLITKTYQKWAREEDLT